MKGYFVQLAHEGIGRQTHQVSQVKQRPKQDEGRRNASDSRRRRGTDKRVAKIARTAKVASVNRTDRPSEH